MGGLKREEGKDILNKKLRGLGIKMKKFVMVRF
jgi:hypothetical protein